MTRKALPLVAALALACLNLAARAQYTAYGMVTVEQLSSIQSSPLLNTLSPAPCASGVTQTPASNCTQYNNDVHPIGFTGGLSRDIHSFGPAMLSVDLRGVVESDKRGAQSLSDGSGTRIYSGLGGIRASFHTPYRWLTAYGQGSVGYARSNYGVLTNATISNSSQPLPGLPTQNNIEYHAFAGAEIKITPLLDFRVFELGYGALQSFGTYAHSYPLYSVSTGIVLHIPPRDAQ